MGVALTYKSAAKGYAMSGRERIENLTNSWYGYALFTGLLNLLDRGFGLWSIVWTALGVGFSFFITYLIGNRLLAKSSLTRLILLGVSLLGSVFAATATVKLTGSLFTSFHLGTLFEIGIVAASLGMNVQSFRALTDKSVKTYFA
jgi:hypothetical protein